MNHKLIKILFILPSLRAGGAERVISFVATHLDKNKFDCELLVFGSPDDAAYSINGIKVHFLKKKRLIKAIIPMFKFIKGHKPQIVVGSIAHVNRVLTLYRLYFRKMIFVGREASVDRIISRYANKNRIKYWKLYRNYYRFLDHLICQSDEMAHDLIDSYALSKDKIAIINNPISSNLPLRKSIPGQQKIKRIITIGRLSKEKGHLRLLKLLSKLELPFKYKIIGSGNELGSIMNESEKLGLTNKIEYIPYTDNVVQYLSESDVFLQGSYVEGFPNALLESCVIGTPVIAFVAPGGTKEIVIENVNGFIVNNEDEFLEKLNYTLNKTDWNPELIRQSVTKKFNEDIIMNKFENLFLSLAN